MTVFHVFQVDIFIRAETKTNNIAKQTLACDIGAERERQGWEGEREGRCRFEDNQRQSPGPVQKRHPLSFNCLLTCIYPRVHCVAGRWTEAGKECSVRGLAPFATLLCNLAHWSALCVRCQTTNNARLFGRFGENEYIAGQPRSDAISAWTTFDGGPFLSPRMCTEILLPVSSHALFHYPMANIFSSGDLLAFRGITVCQ